LNSSRPGYPSTACAGYGILVEFLRRRAVSRRLRASCASTISWPRRPCWPSASIASKTPPWGIDGGMGGRQWPASLVNPATNHRARAVRRWSDGNVLRHGGRAADRDRGGGGHGHPFDRPPEHVAEDVAGGFVTAEGSATSLRLWRCRRHDRQIPTAKLRRQRPKTKAFHRHLTWTAWPDTSLAVAVDIGGTFPTVALYDAKSGQIWRAKTREHAGRYHTARPS